MKQCIFFFACLLTTSLMSQDNTTVKDPVGLPVGVQAPDFTAMDDQGSPVTLSEALERGPVVLIFYRGQWCPVCNKHLSAFQDSLDLLTAAGVQVIAISPEKPDLLSKTREKTDVTYTLLYDEDYAVSSLFDVRFTPKKADRIMYNTLLGADLKNAHSDDSEQLPIPATFLIGKDGTIVWRHFDPNYKKRSSVAEILQHLK